MAQLVSISPLRSIDIGLLNKGINLPNRPEFIKYINFEFKNLCVHQIIAKINDEVAGHMILFKEKEKDILYFGFFGADQSNFKAISGHLIDYMIDCAKKSKCSKIRGPINLPTTIFGWGFYESGDTSIAAGTPYSDPQYIQLFKQLGFKTWHTLLWFKLPTMDVRFESPFDIQTADFENRDWIIPSIMLQEKLFPESARLTPGRTLEAFDMNLKFVDEFGYKECIYRAYDRGKLIGIGYCTPNPYDLNGNGKCKSVLLMGGATEPEYQNKGVLKDIFKAFWQNSKRLGITHGEYLVGADNAPSIAVAKGIGGKLNRTYQILEYQL